MGIIIVLKYYPIV